MTSAAPAIQTLFGMQRGNHDLMRILLKTPPAVLCTSMLSNAMLLCSFAILFGSGLSALPECTSELSPGWTTEACEWNAMDIYLRFDARALMNIGHVGLLLIFMTMYWQGGKVYCFYSVKLSFLLMSSAAFGSTVISVFCGESESKPWRILLSLFLFLPSFIGLLSVSFGNRGFKSQPSMSLCDGREEYLQKYADRLEPGEGSGDHPQGLRIAKRLHGCLLIMTSLMIIEMGYSVYLVIFDPEVPVPSNFAAHADALVKAYTTMFHYTFVLATGFAAIARLDDNCDMFLHGAGVFFIFDLSSVLFASISCASGTAMHLQDFGHCVALDCRLLPLRVVVKGVALYYGVLLRPYTLSTLDRNSYAESSKEYRTPRLTLLNMFTYSYLAPPKRHHAFPPKTLEFTMRERRREGEEKGLGRDERSRDAKAATREDGDSLRLSITSAAESTQEMGLFQEARSFADSEREGEVHETHKLVSQDAAPRHSSDPEDAARMEEGDARAIAESVDNEWLETYVRKWRVLGCLCGVSVFAILWLAQVTLMVFIRYKVGFHPESRDIDKSEGSLLPGSPMALLQAFSDAENFGLHGFAFLAFHISLSYQSQFAYPLFRAVHFGSGSIILIISVAESIALQFTDARSLSRFFGVRIVCCALLCVGFFILSTKTFRAHFKLHLHGPFDHLIQRSWGRKNSRGGPRGGEEEEFEIGSDVGSHGDSGGRRDGISHQSSETSDAQDTKRVSSSYHRKEPGSTILSKEDKVKTLDAVKLRKYMVFPGLGDGIYQHEQWMKKVAMGLTATFLLKALFQNLSSSGYVPGKPYGASSFPGIMLRGPGYDCAFHVPYLMTLFLWHGVSSGNLVALDVATCLSISLVLSCISRLTVLLLLWCEQGAMSIVWRVFLFLIEMACAVVGVLTLQGCRRCVTLMRHCSTDPLRTWRR